MMQHFCESSQRFSAINIFTKSSIVDACYFSQMREADAVIILCNKKCVNPEEEDAANTTRFVESCKYIRVRINFSKLYREKFL